MHRIKKPVLLSCLMALCLIFSACDLFHNKEKDNKEKSGSSTGYTINTVPGFSGDPYVEINDNVPYFEDNEYTTKAFESYSELDRLGRCQTACACVCQQTMPTESRGSIGQVKPSGWKMAKYDIVDGGYLYNRCHLIGYQLTAENANSKNLITGTRYLNVEGMLPFENMVADYVKETNNHVLYRVTPVFDGDNLVARGVEMEAFSVEDRGDGISFNVYVYNVQPGISIDYSTGESELSLKEASDQSFIYVLNTKSKKYHLSSCNLAQSISEGNRKEYKGSASSLEQLGYQPCSRCIK